MYFTKEDLERIEKWMRHRTVKDTSFELASSINGTELVPVIQNNENKNVRISKLLEYISSDNDADFFNVTHYVRAGNIDLECAVGKVPADKRKLGLVITYHDKNDGWVIYQYMGESLNMWNSLSYWRNLAGKIETDSYIIPDEEDITGVRDDMNMLFKFKDKEYNPKVHSGLGRVILRKNLKGTDECFIDDEDHLRNILTSDMVNKANTIYEIRYDYDLDGKLVPLPANVTLFFNGGSLKNGRLFCQNTYITGVCNISDIGNVDITGTLRKGMVLSFTENNKEVIKWYDGSEWLPFYDETKNNIIMNEISQSIEAMKTAFLNEFKAMTQAIIDSKCNCNCGNGSGGNSGGNNNPSNPANPDVDPVVPDNPGSTTKIITFEFDNGIYYVEVNGTKYYATTYLSFNTGDTVVWTVVPKLGYTIDQTVQQGQFTVTENKSFKFTSTKDTQIEPGVKNYTLRFNTTEHVSTITVNGRVYGAKGSPVEIQIPENTMVTWSAQADNGYTISGTDKGVFTMKSDMTFDITAVKSSHVIDPDTPTIPNTPEDDNLALTILVGETIQYIEVNGVKYYKSTVIYVKKNSTVTWSAEAIPYASIDGDSSGNFTMTEACSISLKTTSNVPGTPDPEDPTIPVDDNVPLTIILGEGIEWVDINGERYYKSTVEYIKKETLINWSCEAKLNYTVNGETSGSFYLNKAETLSLTAKSNTSDENPDTPVIPGTGDEHPWDSDEHSAASFSRDFASFMIEKYKPSYFGYNHVFASNAILTDTISYVNAFGNTRHRIQAIDSSKLLNPGEGEEAGIEYIYMNTSANEDGYTKMHEIFDKPFFPRNTDYPYYDFSGELKKHIAEGTLKVAKGKVLNASDIKEIDIKPGFYYENIVAGIDLGDIVAVHNTDVTKYAVGVIHLYYGKKHTFNGIEYYDTDMYLYYDYDDGYGIPFYLRAEETNGTGSVLNPQNTFCRFIESDGYMQGSYPYNPTVKISKVYLDSNSVLMAEGEACYNRDNMKYYGTSYEIGASINDLSPYGAEYDIDGNLYTYKYGNISGTDPEKDQIIPLMNEHSNINGYDLFNKFSVSYETLNGIGDVYIRVFIINDIERVSDNEEGNLKPVLKSAAASNIYYLKNGKLSLVK